MHDYYLDKPLVMADHNYAIIDRMLHPDIDYYFPVISLVSPILEHQSHLYPWLLCLNDIEPAVWETLIHQLEMNENDDDPPVICLYLKSKAPVHEIRDQLIKALYFTDENRQGHILRYYDPRVFFHLIWMLTPYQLTQVLHLNDVSQWTFWLEGKWYSWEIPVVHLMAQEEKQTSPFKKLLRCGLVNQVLDKLPRIDDLRHRQKISMEIDRLIFQAMQHQLLTKKDQIAFAIQGLNLKE